MVLSSIAEARGAGDLAVTHVRGAPAQVLTGGEVTLRVGVSNRGSAAAKPAKVVVRLAIDNGEASPAVVGHGRVGRLAAGRSGSVRLPVRVPVSTPADRWRLVVCVAPGTQANDCLASATFGVRDGSAWGRIEAARTAGRLKPGRALLYELYALRGDRRLPPAYRGPGGLPSGAIFSRLATTWPTLSAGDRAALEPYLIQPRYRQSAWAPSGHAKAHASALHANPCGNLDDVKGAWKGVETTHAWFWYRPDRPAARARAHALAAAFNSRIWPKLTGAFKEVGDAAAGLCDPVGDARIDIYLVPPDDLALATRDGPAGGVTPPVEVGPACGPLPSFVIIPDNAKRATLAHEFMHVIQWAYPACDRQPAWVEGTATWAEDHVYPRDQDEHQFESALTAPFSSMLATTFDRGYSAWAFWYSLTKQEGPDAIKRVLDSLATHDLAGALEAGPSDGLVAAWKRYAVQRWNDTPIGSSGFPVAKSYSGWDSFAAKPAGVPEQKVAIGAATTKTFELDTSIHSPLSTWFNRVTVTDQKVRRVEFDNADFGKPGAVVQAFIKLADGSWRLEDWTDRGAIAFCRDRPQENVVELVVASSNASARGGPLGAVKHKVVASNRCGFPARFVGTWTRTFTMSTRPGWTETVNGTGTFVRNSLFPQSVEGQTSIPYDVTSASVTWTVSGSTPGAAPGCTITYSGSGSAPATENSALGATGLTLEDVSSKPDAPKPEPKPYYYSIRSSGDPLTAPQFHIAYSAACAEGDHDESIAVNYLNVGFVNPFDASTPQDQVQKSDVITLLAGHLTRAESGGVATDDTWSFTGSD